jgi:hypothetical protein
MTKVPEPDYLANKAIHKLSQKQMFGLYEQMWKKNQWILLSTSQFIVG